MTHAGCCSPPSRAMARVPVSTLPGWSLSSCGAPTNSASCSPAQGKGAGSAMHSCWQQLMMDPVRQAL